MPGGVGGDTVASNLYAPFHDETGAGGGLLK